MYVVSLDELAADNVNGLKIMYLADFILSENSYNLRKFCTNELFPCIQCKKSIAGGFLLKGYIEERAVNIANYIINCNATVRQTAKQFGISKSTVHKDVTERLLHVNPALAKKARVVLDLNKSERHIRGGMATKEKYLHKNEYMHIYHA